MASTLFASLDEALRDGSSITVERSLALVDSFLAATGEVPLINNMTRDETSGDLGKVVRFRCMVQDVYDVEEMEKDVLKLHEVVEVTGILDCVGVNDLVSNGCLPPIAEESEGNDGGSIRGLAGCIGDLLPRVKEMDVNVEALNSDKLVPRKNYETDELVAGDLQIAPRTYLVFDETRLNPGRFNVDNLRAIQLLVRDQKICVDFGPTRIEFPTEVNCLTLSTSESILSKGGASGPCSVHLPLVPSIDDVDECAQKSSYPLGALRAYLAIVSSLREQVDLSGQLGDDVIPDAWHRARTDDPSISQTDLFIWITLLRPMLLSRGRTEFDEKIWNELLELERQRRARLRKL
ncbi:hypothetical protein FOL47_004385 [Perkinsus chesapeaki]|uniref:Uncharacterized protein n=1 Tax=Perkinsus chesapeaki TaxID=330153 RepID=A0A7J6MZL1_PERCH|nr:hypothetical protein FOL47_004385 [Perkinsus chesapeaki]